MTYLELLERWQALVATIAVAHHKTATALRRRHYWIGVPATVLTAVVGSSVFAAYNEDPDPLVKGLVALLAIGAVVLTAIQTFLNHDARAEQHRKLGSGFGRVLREIEKQMARAKSENIPVADLRIVVEVVQKKWDRLTDQSPPIPERIWQQAQRETGHQWPGASAEDAARRLH